MSTTWNPSDKGSGVTLSGGNLGASIASVSTNGVRATASEAAGKWYFEVAVTSGSGAGFNMGVGVMNASFVVGTGSTFFGSDTNGLAYRGSDGTIKYNATTVTTVATYGSGDTIGVAFDATNRTVSFYKNNVLQATVTGASVPTGALFPAVGGEGGGTVAAGTVNFGATATTYTPPSGYSTIDNNLLSFSMTGNVGVMTPVAASVQAAVGLFGDVHVAATIASAFVFGTPTLYVIPAPTGGMVMGGSATVQFSNVNIYDLSQDGVPQGGMVMGGSALVAEKITYVPTGGMVMSGSAIVLEKIPFTASGGMLMGGIAPVQEITNVTPTGGMVMGGSAPVASVLNYTPVGGMVMSGSAVVRDYQAFYQPSGGMVMGGSAIAYMVASYLKVTTENPYADPFPGWSLNMETHAPARYLNLPANSITQFKGRTFVTNAGGVYEMGADDDAGQPIRASIEFATTDFGNGFEKRMEKAYMGIRTTGKMKLKVMVKGKEPQYYVLMQSLDSVKGTKVPIGKGLVGSYWGMRLDNVDGSDFELGNMEFNPARGQRHGA